MLVPSSGDVVIDGASVSSQPRQAKRSLGVVPQEIALYDDLTGRENLRFFGELYGLAGRILSSRVESILERLQLTEAASRRVGTYSGGMKRRINIGASLLHDPALVLMDEPTVGIDPQSRVAIYELVEQLRGEGVAVLYTTNYMEEAQRLCDRVAIVDHGRVIAEGTVDELLELVASTETVRVKVDGTATLDTTELLDGLDSANLQSQAPGEFAISCDGANSLLPELIMRLGASGVALKGFELDKPNLETVFLEITGRRLRDS